MDWYHKGFWDWIYTQQGRQVKRAEMSKGGQAGVGGEVSRPVEMRSAWGCRERQGPPGKEQTGLRRGTPGPRWFSLVDGNLLPSSSLLIIRCLSWDD